MTISIICTVLNEGEAIRKLLDSLVAQTHQPDEIVIVDGGSTDNTVTVIKQYQSHLPIEIIIAPGANISRGRNIAIEAAQGSIIASTDAGVRLSPEWLARLIAPFQADHAPAVVAGFFVPDPQSTFEVAMGATVLPTASDIDPDSFLPSSRSIAFLKSAWQEAGQYPEWLDFCEDLIFDLRLHDLHGPFPFEPQAVAYFRPRRNLSAFFKQYYQYSRGDGKADLWRKRHAIRYVTYLVGGPLLLWLGARQSPWWWGVGGLLGAIGMFVTPYRRLTSMWAELSPVEKVKAMAWVPVIRITGDMAKMIGYPVGWKWRLERIDEQSELRWRE
ncbi:glycosyltransferase [Anaerolineales bacterium HSG25]|nr:glycosyltransferase [Anaerolineales bacterium HSG25]